MRKMVAMVAFAAALMIGGPARAATVDIFVVQSGPGSADWTINAIAQAGVGQIALTAVGFSAMTLQPLPGISIPDSIRDPGTRQSDADVARRHQLDSALRVHAYRDSRRGSDIVPAQRTGPGSALRHLER